MWMASEDAVRSSGVSWTILRPSGFMSNALRWAPQISAGDVVRAPFANAPADQAALEQEFLKPCGSKKGFDGVTAFRGKSHMSDRGAMRCHERQKQIVLPLAISGWLCGAQSLLGQPLTDELGTLVKENDSQLRRDIMTIFRRAHAGRIASGVFILALCYAAGITHADQVLNEVMLVNAKTNKCLTIAGGVSTDNNVTAVQFNCDSDPSRRWRLKGMPGGNIYQIKNVQTGKCLTIAGGVSTDNNVEALQFNCDTDQSRRWTIRLKLQ
jgi:hypothetical protein